MSIEASQTRQFHWWVWMLCLAVAIGVSTSVLIQSLLIALVLIIAHFVATVRRNSFKVLTGLVVTILCLRIVFQMFFGVPVGNTVFFTLPEIDIFQLGVRVGGIFTLESLQAALSEGLRLAGIVIALLASSLVVPASTLLRKLPPQLSLVTIVLSISLAFLPNLLHDVRRNLRANRWRGHTKPKVMSVAMNFIVVVENALERSIHIAASMWRRGVSAESEHHQSSQIALFGILLMSVSLVFTLVFSSHYVLLILAGCGLFLLLVSLGQRRNNSDERRLEFWAPEHIVGISAVVSLTVGLILTNTVMMEILLVAFLALTALVTIQVQVRHHSHA